ncbi:MAG: ATP-binding protein, partial [Rhodothermia bacterium]
RVKARNIYRHESAEASYDLTVLPRWYETWWAWVLYAAGFVLLVFGLVRIATRKIGAESAILEMQVSERATQLQAQEEQIEKAYGDVELLSRIGRDITATLSSRAIIEKAYESINELMDAAVFGIGIYNEETDKIDFPASKEKGETLPPFSYDLVDPNRLAVWCFVNEKTVFINDYSREYTQYVRENPDPLAGDAPESVIYLPLIHKEEVVGAITVQSFRKNAYTEYHVNILNNIGIFTAAALDNANAYRKLDKSLEDLRVAQEQLISQAKMASLGALTGGIAHEIKNPLNFITNFGELNEEFADELLDELTSRKDSRVGEILEDVEDLLSSLKTNSVQINHHGRRADTIVRSMMMHASATKGERQIVDLNELVDEYVTLSYHGMRAQVPDFNVTIEREFSEGPLKVELVPQDISRVLLNLLNNAFYAVNEEKQRRAELGDKGYAPAVVLQTRTSMRGVEVTVQDNGPGMTREVRDKVFEPFFTTKPTGSGTGLGLSLSFEIITKGHGGTLSVSSDEGKGASFTLTLPT